MAPGVNGILCSVLVLLGWNQLLQAHKVLEVVSGQNVTLECFGPVRSALELLQWVRVDLTHKGYVYFYRENRPYEAYQIPAYKGRVAFRDPAAGPGDVSVVLHEVEPDDTGTYECRTSDQDSGQRVKYYETQARIRLTVKGYHQVHADPGQDLLLPCLGPKQDKIQLLQWSRLDQDQPGYIYVYKLGKPDQIQIQEYKDRVHLRDSQLTGGDAALVLKDVRFEDAGNYSCFILFQRSGSNLEQTWTEPGLQRLEETHHLITLTVSGSPGDVELSRGLKWLLKVLVFVVVLAVCAVLLVTVWRRAKQGVPYVPYLNVRV